MCANLTANIISKLYFILRVKFRSLYGSYINKQRNKHREKLVTKLFIPCWWGQHLAYIKIGRIYYPSQNKVTQGPKP